MPTSRIPDTGRLGALALALAGAGLLGLAVPVLGAAVVRLPGDPVIHALRDGAAVDRPDLHRLADSRRAARAWRLDARDLTDLAMAEAWLAEARTVRGGAPPRVRLLAAEQALAQAIRLRPADPYAWTRLAVVRHALDRPMAEVAAALEGARRTGPNTRRLEALRARLAGAVYGARP
jgi:hypothetical protein